ncbi:PAS domain S-box-containing protein [Algoriphagus ratkowskyi]|uniref:histidine kinase n=1 Tax=Algoriphagus ratkowskyi TaxID=57028 RepID=A0A2W7T4X7_9BACT|nr:PAS domain-containing protein [Algoriphagus ratkowskyi]PZX58232.1 PAS domain S-box-containing protein [Algoriphagus ratkowskyi]TXD77887.1 PAS domain S-box protein [Algoriphagus ratkowskyi]
MKKLKKLFYKSPITFGCVIFFLSLGVGFYISLKDYQLNLIEENNRVQQAEELIENRIQEVIYTAKSSVNILAYLVQTNKVEHNFVEIGKSIIDNIEIIDQIQYLDSGVIVATYPLVGNEMIIGYDILADTAITKEATLAIEKKQLFFAGPINLKQGGKGILARQPLFRDNIFTGFAVVIIDWKKFLDKVFSGLQNDPDLIVDLFKLGPNDSVKTSLLSSDFSRADGFSKEIKIPEGNWIIKVQLNSSQALSSIGHLIVLRVVLALLFAYLIYNLAIQPQKLAKKVRETTRQLRLSNKRFKLATQATSEIIWDWDLEKGHTFRSENFDKLLGYSSNEDVSKDEFWKSKIHPEDIDNVEKNLKETLMGTGDNWSQEFRFKKADGELIYVIDNGLIVRNRQGEAVRIIGSTQNITKRKEAEINLANQRQRLSNVIEGTHAGTWEWNIQTGEAIYNETWANIIGYTLKELEPINFQTWVKLCHPVDIIESEKLLEECFARKIENYDSEFRMKHKSGKWVWIVSRGKVFSWTLDGKPLMMFGTHVDITEKKWREEEVKSANLQLQSVNEELKSFASMASHDMKEPLRMISSFLQLLEKKYTPVLDEKGLQYIYFAVDGAKRLTVLIDDMLEYSRIGFDESMLDRINLNALVKEVITLNKDLMEEKNAQINVGDLPEILGIITPIKSVFINLISNALKYQEKENTPIISIYSKSVEGFCQITVQDNGIGIDEEYFDKVFNVFSRLHIKNEYSGTGIGLAVCKKIVNQHGGKIWVDSSEQGTKFHFTLKLYGN